MDRWIDPAVEKTLSNQSDAEICGVEGVKFESLKKERRRRRQEILLETPAREVNANEACFSSLHFSFVVSSLHQCRRKSCFNFSFSSNRNCIVHTCFVQAVFQDVGKNILSPVPESQLFILGYLPLRQRQSAAALSKQYA